MRQLVRMPTRAEAETLGDALYVEGIDNHVDEAREGELVLWVEDEARLDEAREILRLFEQQPDDPRFRLARREASARRKAKAAEEKKSRHKQVDLRKRWAQQGRGRGPLTIGLIIASIGITFLVEMGGAGARPLFFSLPHILEGEVWRLITPLFVHGGLLHLFFNMWWLYSFGSAIEARQSTGYLLALVLVIGILSNAVQYYVAGPLFGGMSGVVYGLFGYLWLRGKFDPSSGYALAQSTVIILLVWFVFGFTGFMRIANGAHAGGLVIGLLWGFLSSGQIKRMFR